MSYTGTHAFGLRIPIVKQGDDIIDFIMSSLNGAYKSGEYTPQENDIIGITESVVARAKGKYVSVDDVVKCLKDKFPNTEEVIVFNPIFSRNRFSIILKSIARAFDHITFFFNDIDEVGNEIEHKITKMNYKNFYKEICEQENCGYTFLEITQFNNFAKVFRKVPMIDCTLHPNLYNYPKSFDMLENNTISLKDICTDVSEWGLLGSNKMSEEVLKLFPDSGDQSLVDKLKISIQVEFGLKNVEVMVYGDGCYKDATSGIYELADPVVSPVFTSGLVGQPSELKLKYLADDEFKNLSGEELDNAIKERIAEKHVQQGTMETQGTTPRNYTDLLGSLMDLISGSGDKGTPVVVVQNYFKNYSND